MGTRLRSAIPDLPKPMAPIEGKPFLGYLLNYWVGQGIKRFILSVGYKHEVIQRQFGFRYKDTEIHYAVETEPLGTGGGLLLAMEQLRTKESFLILNGDTFFAVNRPDLLNHHYKYGADITLSLAEVAKNNRYSGVLLGEDGWIHSMETRAEVSETCEINGGVYLVDHDFLRSSTKNAHEKCSLEDDLLPEFLNKKKRVAGFLSGGAFIDIGIPQDYERAIEILLPYGSDV